MASKPLRAPQSANRPSQVVSTSQQWSGPLPPPAALEHFNAILPNGAERIVSMVEREQAHRLGLESALLKATAGDTKRGHWLGGAISLASIAAATWTAYIGAHPTVSIALVGLPIAVLVQAIIRSKSNGK